MGTAVVNQRFATAITLHWWQMMALLGAHVPLHRFAWSTVDQTDDNTVEMAAPHALFARAFYSVIFAKLAIAKLFYVVTSTFSLILYVEPKNNSYRLEPRIVSSIHQKPREDVDHGVERITPLPLTLGLRYDTAAFSFNYRPSCLRIYLRPAPNSSAHKAYAR